MRKANAVITALIMLLFVIHGVLGAFQMLGAAGTWHKTIARAAFTLAAVHGVIGVKLTIDTLKAQKKAGVSYPAANRLFWARRISGFALMILLALHMSAFTGKVDGVVRLKAFGGFQLLLQLLLVVTLALHILMNVKPVLISFGIRSLKERAFDILFVLSVLLLFMAAGFVIYYLIWNVW
ncbi:MAG: pilus assembly protein PilX [Blautia sp.]|nr:pilus assembly protein PilX [Blautia sp.]